MSAWPEAKWVVDSIVSKISRPPGNMRKFEATPLSATSIGLKFLEPSDTIDSDGAILCAVTGVMIRMSEHGFPTTPTEGSLVIDNKNLGAYENEAYVVTGLTENKTYYFSAFPYSANNVYNQSSDSSNRASEYPSGVKVYGIKRDVTLSSPVWTRTNSASGLSATASVGTTAGSSDFDSCYPWSDIARETLSTNDVMVRIPKFYYRRYLEGNIEYIQIADGPKVGFSVHPAFNHAGVESNYIYVGAYKTSSNKLSKSGASPQVNQTRKTMRTNAKSKGAGWGIIDISTVSAIQMLYLVEFANNDSQSVIGKGYTNSSNSAAINTGKCNSVPNLTGRPSGTDGATDVVYRGIEGFWGNVYEWVDGINCNGSSYYVCNNPSQYADDTASNYELLSFTAPSTNYISKMGVDDNNSGIMMPSAASGSSSTYYCDYHYSDSSGSWYVCFRGGDWGDGLNAGLFCSGCSYSSSIAHSGIGSRLLYIPS